MDLGNSDSPVGRYDGRSDAELLFEIRSEVTGRRSSEIREWVAIVAWADQNTVDRPVDAATVIEGVVDTGVPIAGDGAPLVSEFNLMELIATLGRSPDGGRLYVGRVIECAWRLPAVYAAVVEGKLAPWRALRIAELTHSLNAEAAGFVGRQLFNAAGCTWAQVERLVTEAIIRHDPERAEAERKKAADQRRFDIDDADANGLVDVRGLMDAADGHTTSTKHCAAAPKHSAGWVTTPRSTCAGRRLLPTSPARTWVRTCCSPTPRPVKSLSSHPVAR